MGIETSSRVVKRLQTHTSGINRSNNVNILDF